MATVYLKSNPSISASCPPLNILQQEVTQAYFAKREDEEQSKTTIKEHTTKAGETLSKIAKKYKVKTKDVKRTKTTKYLQVGEIVKVTTKEKTGVKVKFTKLNKANVGEEVYLVVETVHLEEEIVNINILQGQEDVLEKKDQRVTVQQDDQDVTLIKSKVGNYRNEEEVTNKDEFVNYAIVKVKLQPRTEAKQKQWKDGLECAGEKKALLYLLIDVHTENSIPDFKSEYVCYNGFKSGKDDNNVPNHFLNEEDAWFEVRQLSLDIDKGIKWLDSIDITMSERKQGEEFLTTYNNDSGNLRTDLTDEAEKQMDCSELVCRFLHKIGWSEKVKLLSTAMLYSYAIKHPKQLKINDDENYRPLKGDVFIWKSNSGGMGHTGVVVNYNEGTDVVTTVESITSNNLANENSKAFQRENNKYYKFNFGGVIKCVWNRKEYHLIGHKKTGYSSCRFYTPLKEI